jgi:hypothetical protein
MLEKISEYIDLQILGIACLIFISFIFLKVLFKKISMPRILAIILSLAVIIGNVYVIYLYLEQEESKLVDADVEYYIKGKTEFVSSTISKIRISYTDTNMIIQDLEDDDIVIKVKRSTSIYDRGTREKIKLSDISTGDQIAVLTTVHSLKDGKNEIVATKIYKY